MNSGRDTPLCTAKVKSGEVTLLEPVYDEILAQLKVRNIDVLIVDPFVSSHAVTENDNMAIDAVVKAWARVADAANCAILLVHHTRKENGAKITADSARGGGALIGAVRDCRTLNRMDEDEAKKLGIDNPRGYFKVQSAMHSLSSRASERNPLTSAVLAWRTMSPARRFLPASMKSLDHL